MQASLPKLPESMTRWIPNLPLYEYESPASPHVVKREEEPVLLISPPLTQSPYPWASSSPPSLRTQLLFLLANVSPQPSYRTWSDSGSSLPGRALPALTLPSGEKTTAILGYNEIRPWLDHHHPIYPPSIPHHGYPSSSAEAEARAFGRLIESQVYPAILASHPTPSSLSSLLPLLPSPPPPLAGLSSLLPAFLFPTTVHLNGSGLGSGSTSSGTELESLTTLRRFDLEGIKRGGVEAVKAVGVRLRADKRGQGWFLGCESPSPLDCLIASHLFILLHSPDLNDLNPLRLAVKKDKVLVAYVERVMQELDGRRPSGGEKDEDQVMEEKDR